MASGDRPADRRRGRHHRDHASDGEVEDLCLALAGALHGGRVRRPSARQDAALADCTSRRRGGRARGGPDAHRPADRGDPLDRRDDGKGDRYQRQRRPAHLAGARAAATPGEAIQALQRPGFRRQAARRHRALRRSTGPCHRALGRREEPNSGSRSHPARIADEEGAGRHNDPRL